jgi:hypothetical protein
MERFSRNEIKSVPTLNGEEIRKTYDAYAKSYRVLDDQIQILNWSIDIPEDLGKDIIL